MTKNHDLRLKPLNKATMKMIVPKRYNYDAAVCVKQRRCWAIRNGPTEKVGGLGAIVAAGVKG